MWLRRVKRGHNRLPRPLQAVYVLVFAAALEAGAAAVMLARPKPQQLFDRWFHYENVRGMSRWHDIVDWIGGYPFEVATPDALFEFCRACGFALTRLKTCGNKMGCNGLLFSRGSTIVILDTIP